MLGGMASFMLQLFHKFERKASKGKRNVPCRWLKHKVDTPSRQIELEVTLNQIVSEIQGDIRQHVAQVATS